MTLDDGFIVDDGIAIVNKQLLEVIVQRLQFYKSRRS